MADRYFLNVGTNFNTTANWSTTSGGLPGASVPGASDRIILDANSGNLSLEINISVQGILMDAAYPGTFTQNAFTINYGSTYWTVAGGTFVGSASAITGSTSSRFIMTAGTYTSTSGTHQVGVGGSGINSIDITGGIFNHNNGKILVFGVTSTKLNNLSGYPFFNFEINTCVSCIIDGVIYVDGQFKNTLSRTANASPIIINLKGDCIILLGIVNVTLLGSNVQQLDVQTGAKLGSVIINKTGGSIEVVRDFAFSANWNHIAGTINWNSKKLIASVNVGANTITNGSFYSLEANATVDISVAGTPIQCEADFTLNQLGGSATFPAVKFKGNLSVLTANGDCSGITFNGTGTQNFTSSVASYDVGPIDINKSAGIVTLMSDFSMIGSTDDLNLISGTFNQNGFNFVISDTLNQTGGIYNQGAGTLDLSRFALTLGIFNEGSQGIICRGVDFLVSIGAVFNRSLIGGGIFANNAVATALNLNMNGWEISNLDFARLTSSLTLLSSVVIRGKYKKSSTATTANVIGAGFTVSVHGNIEQANLYSSRVLATSPSWELVGASDQTVIASDGKLDSGQYNVNKPSGKVSQLSAITIDNGQAGDNGLNNLVILGGAWCTNNFNLTVDGTIIVLSVAELRKTPLSVITGTLAGVVTNVNSCDEKKTAFFLVE